MMMMMRRHEARPTPTDRPIEHRVETNERTSGTRCRCLLNGAVCICSAVGAGCALVDSDATKRQGTENATVATSKVRPKRNLQDKRAHRLNGPAGHAKVGSSPLSVLVENVAEAPLIRGAIRIGIATK